MTSKLYLGDCLDILATLDENSIDTCITDPPYGLGFMGKEWDTFDKSQFGIAGNEGENDLKVKKNFKVLPRYNNGAGLYDFTLQWATEVYRVLKPGGLLLAFGGTRTYHRLVCGIEDAGFEIRDTIAWVYGSGFPKSYDISKGIEAKVITGKSSPKGQRMTAMGDDYELTPLAGTPNYGVTGNFVNKDTGSKPMEIHSPEAQLWEGWGTALKPAFEPIVVAMKPIDGNFVNNALTWGVAGLWIDGGRVGTEGARNNGNSHGTVGSNSIGVYGKAIKQDYHKGRFPANFIHDGSDEVLACFPMTGASKMSMRGSRPRSPAIVGDREYVELSDIPRGHDDNGGSASRFFYCAKASRSERNAGLEGMALRDASKMSGGEETRQDRLETGLTNHPQMQNHHPTVKPIALMRYLARITKTPTGGTVLDPFMGSGTTGIACALEGRDFIGIEKEREYYEIAEKRINYWSAQPPLL